MQFFEAGDKSEPLGVGGTSALERATGELDVLANAELPAAGVPVGRGLFGDNEGTARRKLRECLTSHGREGGHILNLGHGITPDADPALVKNFVRWAKEESLAFLANKLDGHSGGYAL